MDFQSVLNSLTLQRGELTVRDFPGWTQGRAVYGGLLAALSLAAAKVTFPKLPPLRSAQITYLAPTSAQIGFRTALLRQGRSTSVVAVDCFSGADHCTRLTFTFGADRQSALAYDRLPMPSVLGPDNCEPWGWDVEMPPFLGQYEMRQAGVNTVLQPSPHDELLIWIRFRENYTADPELALLGVADALPPAALISCVSPAPISTASWSLDLNHPLPTPGWYLLRSTSEQTGNGYSRQSMSCWDETGSCLATGRQTVAIFF